VKRVAACAIALALGAGVHAAEAADTDHQAVEVTSTEMTEATEVAVVALAAEPSASAAAVSSAPAAASAVAAQPAEPGAEVAPASKPVPSKKDPFEGWNRKVFSFNEAIDTAVLKPVAQTYKDVVPEYVRGLIENVFGNIADAWSTVNHLLQGKFESSLQMGFRVATNSVLGFGGLLDIGSEIGLEKQPEDFGQTLGRWGMPSGPYVVLPVLGPSTLRDTAALPVDMQASPTALIDDTRAKLLTVTLVQIVSTRASLLGATNVLDGIALDKYSFLRDAYLARRQNQVYDGDPPASPDEEEDAESDTPATK
jgi:phospholipid-binding lipoprotein MlaA